MKEQLLKKLLFTNLLTEDEKVRFLENIEKFSDEDLDQFESTIDDYDLSAKTVTDRYKANYLSELEMIKQEFHNDNDIEQAVEKIKSGFTKLASYEYPNIS